MAEKNRSRYILYLCEGTGKGCEYHWRDPWRGDKDSSYGKSWIRVRF